MWLREGEHPMSQQPVDQSFVRESWEDADHARDYIDAVTSVGLWESERRLMEMYVPRNGAALDTGCGAGRTTFGLYEAGYPGVTGLDLSNTMIEAARCTAAERGLPIRFDVGDAASMPSADASFDGALFSAQGFMCIPGRERRLKVLTEVRRVLNRAATSSSPLTIGTHLTTLSSGVKRGQDGTKRSRTHASSSSAIW